MTGSAAPAKRAFTERQREAIEHEHGPTEVLAGHGTGKTEILTERHARLIEKRLAWKYDILSITFTRRAAAQMRERIQLRLGEDVDKLPITNIHSFAWRILSNEPSTSEKPRRILDPSAAFKVLRQAMADVKVREEAWNPRFVAALIAEAKEQGLSPQEFLTVPDSSGQQAIARVYARYQALLAENNTYDFSDLILQTARLLETNHELLAQLHEQHRFIQVDEFQDISLGQYQLIKLLTGLEANLFVVGSESQAIYEWRSANYKRLSENFYTDFPQSRQVALVDNFRSREPILKAAWALFNGRYRDADLIAHRGPGEKVEDVRLPNEFDEAAFVVREAAQLHATDEIAWNNIAVIYRTNSQSAVIEREFMRQSVPYTLVQGQRLYQRREVRDIIAYLSLANGGDDESALTQIINSPPRGLGPVSVQTLKGDSTYITWDSLFQAITNGKEMKLRPKAIEAINHLYDVLMELEVKAKELSPANLIGYLLDVTGYRKWLLEDLEGETRLDSIRDLQHEASDYASLDDFLAAVRERIAAEAEHPEGEGVLLGTIHSVKGLQFDVVFVVGVEEGLLPHTRSEWSDAVEAERRLAHVAMTRARERLYLVSTKSRERHGRRIYPRPSRFLATLPREVVIRRGPR